MNDELQRKIERFFSGSPFAVAGASTDREKYGNKVLRCYMQHGHEVFPINPRAEEVEGLKAWPDLASIPVRVHGVSIVTPPRITREVVDEALRLGIRNLWMQPGAEDDEAIARAEQAGANVIARGPCLLVALGFHDD